MLNIPRTKWKTHCFVSIFPLHMKGHNKSTPPMHHVEFMVCEKKHIFYDVYARYSKFLQLKALCFMLFTTSDTRIAWRFPCNPLWNNSSIWCFLQFHVFASIMVFLQPQFSCNLQSKKYNFFSLVMIVIEIVVWSVKGFMKVMWKKMHILNPHHCSHCLKFKSLKVQAHLESAQSKSVRSTCNLMFLCDHFAKSAYVLLCDHDVDHSVKIATTTCYLCVLVWLRCWKCITRLKHDHLLEVW